MGKAFCCGAPYSCGATSGDCWAWDWREEMRVETLLDAEAAWAANEGEIVNPLLNSGSLILAQWCLGEPHTVTKASHKPKYHTPS
jgi:hypothetical protein